MKYASRAKKVKTKTSNVDWNATKAKKMDMKTSNINWRKIEKWNNKIENSMVTIDDQKYFDTFRSAPYKSYLTYNMKKNYFDNKCKELYI